jgi:hypothetical protein
MKKTAMVIAVIMAVCPGAGGKSPPAGYFTADCKNGELVIFGVSARQISRKKEIENARADAAYKAALYYGLKGKIVRRQTSGSGFYDFYTGTTKELSLLDNGGIDSCKEVLRYDSDTGVIRIENSVFVRFTFPAPGFNPARYDGGSENGKPRWVQKLKQIESSDYILAAGFAGRHLYLKDAVTASYENAIAALLAVVKTNIKVMDTDYSNNGGSTLIVETIEGRLSGFHILEIWIDPKTKAVWTLAAAKKM